jgi:hypothetical protein
MLDSLKVVSFVALYLSLLIAYRNTVTRGKRGSVDGIVTKVGSTTYESWINSH